MKIDIVVKEEHFGPHLKPVWDALPVELKGNFFMMRGHNIDVPRADKIIHRNSAGLLEQLKNREQNNLILVAGYGDLSRLKERQYPMILMEHGSGQRYICNHPSYSSGKGAKHNVMLFLSPNEYNAIGHRENYPTTPVEVIGCPKLDSWASKPKPQNKLPVVCISFHWDGRIVPETRSTWDYYKDTLEELSQCKEFNLIGHGHPRIFGKVKKQYDKLGIPYYKTFNEVVEIADVYVCDNSSTIFEFAYLNRPVVVLNAPYYRRNVEHGLRFWEFSDIGFNCDYPKDLKDTILTAIYDDHLKEARRKEIIEQIYPYRGYASQVAAGKLMDFVEKFPYSLDELNEELRKRIYNYRHTISPFYSKKMTTQVEPPKRSNQKIHDLQRQKARLR